MTNEVRKLPREWWIVDSNTSGDELFAKQVDAESTMGALVALGDCPDITHVREVLPGDDSLRISRKDWHNIQKMFLEFDTAEKFLRAANIVERIERESKGE